MLISSKGERAGTVSGGCLEAEISRKIWWLTAQGPRVEQYQSSFDEDMLEDGAVPWGLGCGGTVWVLMERDPSAVLQALAAGLEESRAAVTVAALEGERVGTRAVLRHRMSTAPHAALGTPLALEALCRSAEQAALPGEFQAAAARAMAGQASLALDAGFESTLGRPTYYVEYLAPAPRLFIFGAGDDAQPIAAFAEALGWRIAVADGRSHLLRRERFPAAAEFRLLTYTGAAAPVACVPGVPIPVPARGNALGIGPGSAFGRATPRVGIALHPDGQASDLQLESTARSMMRSREPDACAIPSVIPATDPGTGPGDLAVVLTHSFEQDRALLAALLPQSLAYLGILGPRHRTLRLLAEVAPTLGWTVDDCWRRLRAPVGLDLGARDPASIALAIVAEMQATLTGRHVAVTRASHPERARAPEKARV